MFLRRMLAVLPVALLILGATCALAADRSSDEKAIRDLDAAWAQAAQSKDADKTASFYADDAFMLPQNAPIGSGKTQIRDAWAHFMATPGFCQTQLARSAEA